MDRARRLPYKKVNGIRLNAYAFNPEGHSVGDKRPCAIFFFGSGWDNGVVTQFAPHCVYLASRGMVGFVVEYRVSAKHGSTPTEAMADARSVVRWVRMNAEALGVDPDRIAGAGASAGAHVILSSAMIEGVEEPGEDRSVNPSPNALVLFSPVVDISPAGFGVDRFSDKKLANYVSPLRHVEKGLPPSVIFHGKSDRVIPAKGIRKFWKKMQRKGNHCELFEYDGQGHGFFNFNVNFQFYEATIAAMDRFFVDLGYMEKNPEDDGSLRLG